MISEPDQPDPGWLELVAWLDDPSADPTLYVRGSDGWVEREPVPVRRLRSPRKLPEQPGTVRYLTLQEAAAIVRASPETIRYWIWQGRLTAYKPGRAVLVQESELRALIEAGETRKLRAAADRSRRC